MTKPFNYLPIEIRVDDDILHCAKVTGCNLEAVV